MYLFKQIYLLIDMTLTGTTRVDLGVIATKK